MWRIAMWCGIAGLAACGVSARAPAEPSGEVIAFGGGAGGAADACFLCHGLQGEGIDEAALAANKPNAFVSRPGPALSGQSYGYLVKQLDDYARKRRDDPIMSPIAARMDSRAQQAVAAYYASGPAPDRVVGSEQAAGIAGERGPIEGLYLRGDPARGIESCAMCHGAAGEGAGLARPSLSGLSAGYIETQLLAWKSGQRRNDGADEMGRAARQLTEAEIVGLATYITALRP